ncbi:MAG TPA: biotin/lipoyl-binding protein [Gemmatimonadaceae bacterium]|nr:biotin/lipoyl-binding protein [Gemmatimonadaceae bacterium]
MRKTTMAVSVAALTALVGGAWLHNRADAKETPAYRFGAVERGNQSSTVSATGVLSAVRTVQVGTRVSGQISSILADFNARVKKGQLFATIDPTLQRQTVQDAQAGLERTRAQLELAQEEYSRNKQLLDARIVTAAEFGPINAN